MAKSARANGQDRMGRGPLARSLGAILFVVVALGGVAQGAKAPAASAGGPEGLGSREARVVFEQAQDKVFQVRVILRATESQTTTGSGFLVGPNGHALTNYHVVSDLALEPERHRLEYVRAGGSRGPLELVAVDVIHDLAIVRMQGAGLPYFRLRTGVMGKGDRGYSFGNPLGVGLSIVEGTYNGLAEDSLYDLIHFTGAINPGMSGGPTVTPAGEVFGVNVATHRRGQLVGYLVPVDYARALFDETQRAPRTGPQDFRREITSQLLRHQDVLLGRLLAGGLPVQSLGSFVVPDRPAPFMHCWGNAGRETSKRYEQDSNVCDSLTGLYVDRELRAGSVRFEHMLLRPKGIGAWRFTRLLSRKYGEDRDDYAPRKEFTRYACAEEFVDTGGLTLRAVVCLRAYRRLAGLYDLTMRFVSVNSGREGLIGELTLGGVGHDLGTAFARRYLESVAWKP